MKSKKGHSKKRHKPIFWLLILFLSFLICLSGYFFLSDQMKYAAGKKLYDEIASEYLLDDSVSTAESDDGSPDGNLSEADGIVVPPQIDDAGLKERNKDYIGWLRIEGLGVDLPIVKGNSNKEYLHLGFDRKYLYQGNLFAEYRNAGDFSDPNTIIYGHNMKNGSMFGGLRKYLNKDFAHENSCFWICTEGYGYLYRIDSIRIVRYDGDTYTLFSDFDETYSDYIHTCMKQSRVDMNTNPDDEARTVTLSTCYGAGSKGNRLVVQAYREGVYPSAGCSEEEAVNYEMLLRSQENTVS